MHSLSAVKAWIETIWSQMQVGWQVSTSDMNFLRSLIDITGSALTVLLDVIVSGGLATECPALSVC